MLLRKSIGSSFFLMSKFTKHDRIRIIVYSNISFLVDLLTSCFFPRTPVFVLVLLFSYIIQENTTRLQNVLVTVLHSFLYREYFWSCIR